MDRKRAAQYCIVACTLIASCASAQDLAAIRPKVDPEVVRKLETGKPVEVLVRLTAKSLQDQIVKETDAIYADSATDEKEKKALNDAAYTRYRERLSALKAAAFPPVGIPDVKVIGDVSSGPEVVAIVGSLEALVKIASNPLVLRVFVNGSVRLD